MLDVDALVHARHPGLLVEIEAVIRSLPDGAYIERSVYHHDAARSGLLPLLDGWRTAGLLHDPVDYRRLPEGDSSFRQIGRRREWKSLSPEDRATLVLIVALGDGAVLTCERLLAKAVREHSLPAVDLFDMMLSGLRTQRLTDEGARKICAEWDRNPSGAGRPIDYHGSFDAEFAFREAHRPLPF